MAVRQSRAVVMLPVALKLPVEGAYSSTLEKIPGAGGPRPPAIRTGTALWSSALLLTSAPKEFASWVRLAGIVGSILLLLQEVFGVNRCCPLPLHCPFSHTPSWSLPSPVGLGPWLKRSDEFAGFHPSGKPTKRPLRSRRLVGELLTDLWGALPTNMRARR